MSSLVEKDIMEDALVYTRQLSDDESVENDVEPKPRKNAQVSAKANDRVYSPSDPDARLSVKRGKMTRLNYSSHVSVDTQNHVIGHIQAFHADKGDAPCLPEC